jgi:hypothetical protein
VVRSLAKLQKLSAMSSHPLLEQTLLRGQHNILGTQEVMSKWERKQY